MPEPMKISRKNPGCVVFLVDRSDSMRRAWADGLPLAAGAATSVNRALYNLVIASTPTSARTRHYFDVGVIGYGLAAHGEEGVESAFGGDLAGRDLVPIPELAAHPLGEVEVPSPDRDGPVIKESVWVEPLAGQQTPMCQAIALAGAHVHEWVRAHPTSVPPVVINITDGQVTDRYGDTPLREWADRLRTLGTEEGPTVFFNVFLSPRGGEPVLFPNTADGLPDPGPELFEMSSVLPERFVEVARDRKVTVADGARAFCFNANFATLQFFLQIGSDLRDPWQ